jgi:hypothetical protein
MLESPTTGGTVNLNGADFTVNVTAIQSSEGPTISLGLGDGPSVNAYPVYPRYINYDSNISSTQLAAGSFQETAAHEVGHFFLTDAFGEVFSWGHEGTANATGAVYSNSPQYPSTGPYDLMRYHGDTPNVFLNDVVNRSKASGNDIKTLIYISGRTGP